MIKLSNKKSIKGNKTFTDANTTVTISSPKEANAINKGEVKLFSLKLNKTRNDKLQKWITKFDLSNKSNVSSPCLKNVPSKSNDSIRKLVITPCFSKVMKKVPKETIDTLSERETTFTNIPFIKKDKLLSRNITLKKGGVSYAFHKKSYKDQKDLNAYLIGDINFSNLTHSELNERSK